MFRLPGVGYIVCQESAAPVESLIIVVNHSTRCNKVQETLATLLLLCDTTDTAVICAQVEMMTNQLNILQMTICRTFLFFCIWLWLYIEAQRTKIADFCCLF